MSSNAPRTQFESFLSTALQNAETRAAYEDSQARHRLVDVLVRMRNRFGLTQTDVARSMGIKQPAVSGFETEGSDPRLSTLQRYARAVDASLWMQVIPNGAAGRRVELYIKQDEQGSPRAQHAAATPRAETWAAADRRYRHLELVPDGVPA